MESRKALEILEDARAGGDVVCLYHSSWSDKFAAGFVGGASERHVVLRSLEPGGRADGWFLRALDDIVRIDWRGQYEERLKMLAQLREARWKIDFLPPVEPATDLPLELLLAARHHDLPVQLDTGSDEAAQGFVAEVTGEFVTLDKIACDGSFDGHCVMALDEVAKILVDEEALQTLGLLALHRGRGAGKWQ